MTINVDLSNPYVITTIVFFLLIGIVNTWLQLISVRQKRQLLKYRQSRTAQLQAALEMTDTLLDHIEGMELMMINAGVRVSGKGLPERARKVAQKLREDAGL